jgi:hypothetical protein
MAGLEHKHFPLEGMTLVSRKHERDISLPGMTLVENGLVARSDSTGTLRPDFDPADENIVAITDAGSIGCTTKDYLNSVSGIYGSSSLVWFTTYVPYSKKTGTDLTIISDTYTTGTVRGTSGQSIVTGSGTSWLQNAYRGMLLEINDDGVYYVVDRIDSDTLITIDSTLSATYAGDTYKLYYNHNPYLTDYSLNVQHYIGEMIYSNPTINDTINPDNICGPWHSLASEDYGTYAPFWWEDDTIVGTGVENWTSSSLAYSGTKYIRINESTIPAGLGDLATATTIESDDTWTIDATWYSAIHTPLAIHSIKYEQSQFMITGEYDDGVNTYVGVAISTDDGENFTLMRDDSYDENYECNSVAYDGTTYVIIVSRESTRVNIARYSTDNGATWATATGFTFTADNVTDKYKVPKVKYINGQFVICSGSSKIYYGDGTSFTEKIIADNHNFYDIDWGGVNYVVCDCDVANNGILNNAYYCDTLSGTWTPSPIGSGEYNDTSKRAGAAHMGWDSVTGRFVVALGRTGTDPDYTYKAAWSDDQGVTWTTQDVERGNYTAQYWEASNVVFNTSGYAVWTVEAEASTSYIHMSYIPGTGTEFIPADYTPLSILYRANTFSSLDGYVVLFSTREYAGGTWTYHPRRIRWTSPGTVDDFSATGAGTAELRGTGHVLDSRPVNGRIVLFETSVVGALVPRGITTDPWDYDVIKDDFRILSNPVVVDDACYVVGSDGLLHMTDGVSVKEMGTSFDLTQYDDYDEDKPVWLGYSAKLKSLMIYQADSTASVNYCYTVNVVNGTVAQMRIDNLSDSGGDSELPRAVLACTASTDQRVFVTHAPVSNDTDRIIVGELSAGSAITGTDERESTGIYDTYWYGKYRTGELYPAGEGNKAALKHAIVRTYADVSASTHCPDVAIGVRSNEDSGWHYGGQDTTGTIALTTSTTATGTGTVWSNTIYTEAGAGTTVHTLPWQATQCQIYIDSTLQVLGTDYTITDTKQITLGSAMSMAEVLYAYSNNAPEIKIKAGDYIESDEGFHRIASIESATSLTLVRGLASGTSSGTHYPAQQMGAGDYELKLGINKLVEGVQFQIHIFPRDNAAAPTVAKVTGITIGYVQARRKTLEATGS